MKTKYTGMCHVVVNSQSLNPVLPLSTFIPSCDATIEGTGATTCCQ